MTIHKGDGDWYELYIGEQQVSCIKSNLWLALGRDLTETEAFLLEHRGYAFLGGQY